MAPSENSTNTGDDDDNNRDDHRSDDHHNGHANDNNVPVGAIIGAVIGGVVLIILLLLVFFYRKRFTHQRKVNQFHRERMLFHQQPPPSFISSTGASTVLPHVTSPQATLTARPLSPKRPSHIPGEFEGTARKNYPYPVHSDDHSDSLYSPSSYSFALPNVESTPVFRAQHAPAMGTQQV
ncbi:hypothetical protein L218DRAFT_1010250 [Marasmius fiardii PR-910]|nr:hypothetical protein L218DRAFT_1010250 [Marasmius fiardii PR-910]